MGRNDHLIIVTDVEGFLKKNPGLVKGWCLGNLRPGSLVCTKCGEVFTYLSPVSMGMASEVGKAFERRHKRCAKEDQGWREASS